MDIHKEERKPMHINVLPFETVGQVLRELSVVDRLQCEGVNPRWKAITWELGWTEQKKLSPEIIFEGTRRSQKEKFDNESLVALFRHVSANLIELDLKNFSYSRGLFTDVFQWLNLLPNLAKLNIRGFNLLEAVDFLPDTLIELLSSGPFDEQNLTALTGKCPSLESIHFNDNYYSVTKSPIYVMNAFLGKYHCLKTLHFIGNFIAIDNKESLTSLGQLHQLEELQLERVTAFDDTALMAVATGCRRLKSLKLNKIGVSEEAIRELNQHPNLLDFELKNHPNLNANIEWALNGRWKKKKYNYLCSRMPTDNSVLGEVLEEVTFARKVTTGRKTSVTRSIDELIDDLIEWRILPLLNKSLSSRGNALKHEALWTLTNITAGSSEQTGAVVEAGAVPEMIKLLGSESAKVREQSLWTLANIIGDGPKFRDHCIELGIVEPLLTMVEVENTAQILEHIAWIFQNICRWKDPPPSMDTVKAILPALGKLMRNSDIKIIQESVLILADINWGGDEQIQLFIDAGIVAHLIPLLAHSDEKLKIASFCFLANITSGTDEQTQFVLDSGALKAVPALIAHPNDKIVKSALLFLSNIAAGNENQIQAVFDTGMVPVIVQIIVRYPDLRKEAVWVISNIAKRDRTEHIHYLVDYGVIPALCNLLGLGDDNGLLLDILDTSKNVLNKSGTRTGEVCEIIKHCEGLDKIKNLLNHNSESVKNVATEIVDGFFSRQSEGQIAQGNATETNKN